MSLQNYLLMLAWSSVINFLKYICSFNSPLVSTCKAHKPKANTRHTMYHTCLYIFGKMQKISVFVSFFQFNFVMFSDHFVSKKIKTVRHLDRKDTRASRNLRDWSHFLIYYTLCPPVISFNKKLSYHQINKPNWYISLQ